MLYIELYFLYFIITTDAVAFSNAHFGVGSGTIHLHVVGCTGEETNLTDCHEIRSGIYCLQGHSEDAGVRCQGLIEIHIIKYMLWLCRSLHCNRTWNYLRTTIVLLFYSCS